MNSKSNHSFTFRLVTQTFLVALAMILLGGGQKLHAQYSLSNLWQISTSADRPYVTTNATERGIAYNPINNHVYLVSRAATLRVAILDGDTGAEIGFLPVTGISGGTFTLSTIAVAEDGAIYGANLVTSISTPLRVYRWADESSLPVRVFDGFPDNFATPRWGDNLDIRGGGASTEILVAGANNTNSQAVAAILQPTDDTMSTFTNFPVVVSGIPVNDMQKGVAFGTNNTFYARRSGLTTLRHMQYDLNAGTATVIASYTINAAIAGIASDVTNRIIAGVQTGNTTTSTNHQLIAYDASIGGTLPLIGSIGFPSPATSNANVVGAVDIAGNRIYAVDTQNGVLAVQIVTSSTPVAPDFVTQPGNQTVVQGGYTSLTGVATGTQPITYQWQHNGVAIPNATNTTLLLTNITLAAGGDYQLVASNTAGSANSATATLTITPAALSAALTPLWKRSPGELPFLNATDNGHRGMAYNPQTGHLLVVSRTGSNAIHIVDANTGDHLGALNPGTGVITGGTLPLNLVSVTDDGFIYACNVTLNGTTDPLRIYLWADESPSTEPLLAWSGDPGAGTPNRWGDTLAGRLGGTGHEMLVSSRLGTAVALLLLDFAMVPPVIFDVPGALAGNFGLGLAWGSGDRFWGKSAGQTLQHLELDLGGSTARVLHNFTDYSAMSAIAVSATDGLLAGLSTETPDNLRLLDISNPDQGLPYLDTEFWPTDNANSNGTGSIAFGPERIYALDSNNGLVAFRLAPRLRYAIAGSTLTFTWSGSYTLQSRASLTSGTWADVSSTSGHQVPLSSAAGEQRYFRLRQ